MLRREVDPKTRTANASLSEDEVRTIRRLGSSGEKTVREMAEFYQVGRETIRRIIRRETWDWIKDYPLSEAAERDLNEAAEESALRLAKELGIEIAPRGEVK